MSNDALKKLLYIVAGFGVVLTITTELSHYYPALLELCGGQTSGCADVTATPYAKMFGLSVAYWGLLSYVVFLFLLYYSPMWTLPLASAVMGAELYFLWIMHSVLQTYCRFCLVQFVTATVLFILSLIYHRKYGKFSLPGKLWSAPVVVLAVFAALVLPVKMGSKAVSFDADNLVTYEGNLKSPLRVEVFFDYECGACKKFGEELVKLREQEKDILIVYRNFIIGSHQISPVAVSYAEGISFTEGREAYVKAHDELFDNQERLYDYLQKHLDKVKFTDELKEKINAKVNADLKRAKELEIFSTPTLVISRDGKVIQVVRGITPYETFAKFLK